MYVDCRSIQAMYRFLDLLYEQNDPTIEELKIGIATQTYLNYHISVFLNKQLEYFTGMTFLATFWYFVWIFFLLYLAKRIFQYFRGILESACLSIHCVCLSMCLSICLSVYKIQLSVKALLGV